LYHGGQTVVLLNRAGVTSGNSFGYGDAGFNITLTDSASTDIHLYGGNGGSQLTGSYKPDGRNIDPLSTGATFDSAARQNSGAPFGLFNNVDPHGEWKLFIADMSGGAQSQVASWGLEVTAVPEPVNIALGIFGALVIGSAVVRRRYLRNLSPPD
jgi:hypothetical protein